MGQFSTSFAILNAFLNRNKGTVITMKAILEESRACASPKKAGRPPLPVNKELNEKNDNYR